MRSRAKFSNRIIGKIYAFADVLQSYKADGAINLIKTIRTSRLRNQRATLWESLSSHTKSAYGVRYLSAVLNGFGQCVEGEHSENLSHLQIH